MRTVTVAVRTRLQPTVELHVSPKERETLRKLGILIENPVENPISSRENPGENPGEKSRPRSRRPHRAP